MQLPVQLRKRNPDTHKGDYGYVLVLGGSSGLTGAVCLCAQGCLRIGAGLVKVGVPESLHNIFEIKLTEPMSVALKEEPKGYLSLGAFSSIKKLLAKIDVIVLGPGAFTNVSTKKLILKIIKEIDKPMVVDADGINALVGNLEILKKHKSSQLVLTPHAGEFSRLIGLSPQKIKNKRKELVKKFALRYNLTLVFKGFHTLVSDGKSLFENKTGNPGMATAGMGDVLSGMIAGLMAQGIDSFSAAKTGVYLHGLAADLAAKDKTQNCLIASDVLDYLPKAIKGSLKRAPEHPST